MIAAVVLAAGAGRRMGGTPKALLVLDGRPFLELVVEACRRGGCERIVVVGRPGAPEIDRLAAEAGATTVMNPEPERGMFSSARLGIHAALATDAPLAPTHVLLHAVDHPRVLAETITTLVRTAARTEGRCWLRPAFGGRGGHPILVDADTARGLLARAPEEPLRDALRALDLEPTAVPVEDPGVRANLNTPAELDRLPGRTPGPE